MSTIKTTPCHECPFRKKSLRGYVGGHKDVQEIVDIVYSDQKFPCHLEVTSIQKRLTGSFDKDEDFFEQADSEAPVCAGSAAMLRNTCKLSRDKEVMATQKIVGKRDDVFANGAEMVKYHNSKNFLAKRKKSRKS